MNPLFVAIDIGNSSTSIGVFPINSSSTKSTPHIVLETPTSSIYKKSFFTSVRQALKKHQHNSHDIEKIYVSSVVPKTNKKIKSGIKKTFGITAHFISYKSPSQLSIRYENPNEVGADRIANARGGLAFHHGPLIVVDFGTATTFDCVSNKNEYLGGIICAGPVLSAEALFLKTAKLPYVHLEKPTRLIGKNTVESIQAGLFHGYRGLVREIVHELKQKLGVYTYVIATGGQAQWLLKGINSINQFVPELTLIGLYMMWNDSQKSSA